MNKIILFVIFSFFYFTSPAQAGDSGPLCDALANPPSWVKNDYIVEVEINPSIANYTDSYAKKDWMPAGKELEKIVATAKVVSVLKGNLKPGDTLPPADTTLHFLGGSETGVFWKTLFTKKKVILLTGPSLDNWAVDASLSAFPIVNLSFLKGYETYKHEVKKCLSAKK